MKKDISKYSKELFANGFTHVKSLLNKSEIELAISAIESNIQNPSPFAKNIKSENGGVFFLDYNNWRKLPLIEKICKLPKIIDLITALTNSQKCWLFHDNVFIKKDLAIATPPHQDRPYYIFKGDLNLSVWITVDHVDNDSSLIFYKGSHKTNKIYTPKSFVDGSNIFKNSISFENISSQTLKNFEKKDFDMKPGDALIFFNKTIHSSHPHCSNQKRRALSIRYLLDGACLTKQFIVATPPYDKMGVEIIEDGEVPEKIFPLLKY
jgi:ectoine hydroxylase-related dioxygenase (phytanoyl-CoA dioxygenase family)